MHGVGLRPVTHIATFVLLPEIIYSPLPRYFLEYRKSA